jgi:hypothetical protein
LPPNTGTARQAAPGLSVASDGDRGAEAGHPGLPPAAFCSWYPRAVNRRDGTPQDRARDWADMMRKNTCGCRGGSARWGFLRSRSGATPGGFVGIVTLGEVQDDAAMGAGTHADASTQLTGPCYQSFGERDQASKDWIQLR